MMYNLFPLLLCLCVSSGFLAGQIFSDYWSTQASISPQDTSMRDIYQKNFKILEGLSHDGKIINLSKLKAPVVILNFWADWCIPCLEEFPSLVELRKRYRDDQVYILGISESENQKKVQKIYEKYHLNFPSILSGQKWIDKYNIQNFPFSIIYIKGDVMLAKEGKKDFLNQKLLDKIAKFFPQK